MKGSHELWERLDLPGETLPGQVLVEIAGESRVLVEHHLGVREYTRQRIGIQVKFGLIQVTGDCLALRRMTREQLVITGRIDSVVLNRRGPC